MPVAFLSSHLEDNIDEYINKYYKQDMIFCFFSFFLWENVEGRLIIKAA